MGRALPPCTWRGCRRRVLAVRVMEPLDRYARPHGWVWSPYGVLVYRLSFPTRQVRVHTGALSTGDDRGTRVRPHLRPISYINTRPDAETQNALAAALPTGKSAPKGTGPKTSGTHEQGLWANINI